MTNIGNPERYSPDPLGEEIAKIFRTYTAERLSAFGCILADKAFVFKEIVQCHIFTVTQCHLSKRGVLGQNKQ